MCKVTFFFLRFIKTVSNAFYFSLLKLYFLRLLYHIFQNILGVFENFMLLKMT
jgi:hypothetical protein